VFNASERKLANNYFIEKTRIELSTKVKCV